MRVDDSAGIWLAQAEAPELFDTRAIRPPLEDFLEREVQSLLERPADQAPWHVYYRCEWCPYFDHCRAEMARTDDISRLPYLSSYAKQFLATQRAAGAKSLADLEGLLDDPIASAGARRLRLAPRPVRPPAPPGPGDADRRGPGPPGRHARHAQGRERPPGRSRSRPSRSRARSMPTASWPRA